MNVLSKSLVLSLAFIATANAQPTTSHPTAAIVCDVPKSGIIGIGDAQALSGPFLVSSLQALVDPKDPKKVYVIWTRNNVWFAADDFKGPFFLEKGDRLVGREDYTHIWGAAYSGYACR